MKKLTKRDARRVLKVVDHGLTLGLGNPKPGELCVMAAINLALGEEHGDQPTCVHPIIRSFNIVLNDAKWSSNKARAKGMRREAIAELGSTEIDGRAWLGYVIEQHIKRILPIPLRICVKFIPDHATALNKAADNCEKYGTEGAAWSAASAAAGAVWSAASAAWSAESAAWGAARGAARSAARSAAWSAASAAEGAAWSAVTISDEILTLSAEIATEACIKVKTQGSKWLDLAD